MDETSSPAERDREPTRSREIHERTASVIEEKQEMFDLLGKSYMMLIASIFAGSEAPWRFNELRDETGISQTTLSARLTELDERGLVTRRSYDEIPPRVEYEATQKLRDLRPIIADLFAWWREDEEN